MKKKTRQKSVVNAKKGSVTPQAAAVYQRRGKERDRESGRDTSSANNIYGARPNADCQRKGNAHKQTHTHIETHMKMCFLCASTDRQTRKAA